MKKLIFSLILCFGIVSPAAFAQDETEADSLADYNTACLAAIDNISKIGDSFAMRSMISIAKASLGVSQTKDAMRRTMTALRAGVLGYLQTTGAFQDEQVFTGLVGNHSFDTGDLSLWYSIGFDLSQIGLSDITNAISGGDVSGLVNAVSVNNWNEDTKAIENAGGNAISGGDQKYYLNSSQLIMQPLIGLPAGIYSFSAKVACNPGFFRLNKVHLNALVIPTNIVQEILGDMLSNTTDWTELLSNFDMTQYIGVFIENGKLYTESASCQNLNTFSDGELRFIIDEGDVVIIGMNAGMVPFIGTEQYRADNLQLTGLRAAETILTTAKADLAEALKGHSAIEANYNADAEGTAAQPAFSYDRTLTENYNNALLSATDKYNNDKLADLLTKSDLSNLDGLDNTLKGHYSKDILALEQAKDIFDKQAFIAPKTGELFNILMRDDWISLLSTKWTGNAVTIGEDMTMQFSQKPGQSVFTLAFGFESASDTYSNQLRAFVHDYRSRYYLGEKDGSLVLTAEPAEAITITAIPSYTEEGEIALMNGDLYLGTSNQNNTFISTNSGTLLRPTRTGLSVVPASEMELTVTIPEGQNISTLILPFDAELPEGVSASTITDIGTTDGVQWTMCDEPSSTVRANTPYIIMAEAGDYTYRGVPHAIQPSYQEGLLIGQHTPYTTEGGNEYTLTEDDGYRVFRRTDGQTVAASECYLKSDATGDIIYVSKDDADGIGFTPALSKGEGEMINGQCYDLSGRKIVNCQLSNSKSQKVIYIRNGRKVIGF